MRILYLDDDEQAIEVFTHRLKEIYRVKIEVIAVDNLVSFDDMLQEDARSFDGIVMDLGLADPVDIPKDEYEIWLCEKGLQNPTRLKRSIPVVGWDYFNRVMREQDATKDRLDTVLIKTGYADLLVAEYGPDCCAPATLLSKGDEHYDQIVNDFLKRLEK